MSGMNALMTLLLLSLEAIYCRPPSGSASGPTGILPRNGAPETPDDRDSSDLAAVLSRFQEIKEKLKSKGISANSIRALSYVDGNGKSLFYHSTTTSNTLF